LRLLERRAPRVDDAREQELVEPLRQIADVSRVEVDADAFDGQLGEPVLEQLARVAERDLEGERRPARERLERLAQLVQPAGAVAGEERLAEDDELRVQDVELRLQDA